VPILPCLRDDRLSPSCRPADNLEVLCILKSEEGGDIGMAHIPYIGIFDDEENSDRKPSKRLGYH
jgi:hypothetical protein